MRFEYFFRHRHRVTPRDRRPGALQVQIYFSIDEGDRVHAEGPASAKSSKSTIDTTEEGVGHSEIGGGDGMCKERTVGGRLGEGLRASPTKGACGVFRRESRMLSEAVESVSLPELLDGYSCCSAGRST